MSRATLARLRTIDLFDCCRRRDLATIDGLGATLDLRAGCTLCREGRPGAEFFVLLDGLVDVHTASGTAAVLRPGAWFGEAALIDHAPRRATVTARTPVIVIVFGKREFTSLLACAPGVREKLERTTAHVVAGDAPTGQPWFQPLPSRPPVAMFDHV